jgi:1,4-dihydroxy-2-naphthoate polyprenyltransferase
VTTLHTGRAGRGTSLSVWLTAARPKTLWAAVAPVVLGSAIAIADGGFHLLAALCALGGAMLIQIATNYSNDYHDYVKGADTSARKGPVRATQAGLVSPRSMRFAAALTFALAVVAGFYLIWRGGLPVLAIGVASILSGIWYTAGRYSLAYLGLADVFVLVFFGPIAVAGTHYVQVLEWSQAAIIAGFGPGFLAVAILLVNNIRDVDEDRSANKRTLVVRIGREYSIGMYAVMLLAAALVPAVVVLAGIAPAGALAASLVPLGAAGVFRDLRRGDDPSGMNPLLARTSQILFVYALIFATGWIIGP